MGVNMPKIYAVDDEEDIREILSVNLKKNGYDIRTFSSSFDLINELKTSRPDLFILDIMMGGMDGLDLCKMIRSSSELKNIPILFLSARSSEFDKVLGLELGADDYLSKPFGIQELLARIKALLRRGIREDNSLENDLLTYKGIVLFPQKYMVKVDGDDIELTKTEFLILKLFMQYPGKVFSRENIIDSIRGYDIYVIDRTVDVHIMNLRKKLKNYKDSIKTYSGIGYGLKELE